MDIELRLEEEKDHDIVEELTRDAFWNVYVPGADEHFLIHNLRKTEEFVQELDFVAVYNGRIIGNIVYARSRIIDCEKEHTVLTFGPVSVLPEYQNKGVGSKLINHTIKLSANMGYKAVLIYGSPDYYIRFGFKASKEYHITNKDGKFPAALLALELRPGALKDIKGIFDEGCAYQINQKEAEAFDRNFPKKEKFKTKSQERFIEESEKYL